MTPGILYSWSCNHCDQLVVHRALAVFFYFAVHTGIITFFIVYGFLTLPGIVCMSFQCLGSYLGIARMILSHGLLSMNSR